MEAKLATKNMYDLLVAQAHILLPRQVQYRGPQICCGKFLAIIERDFTDFRIY